MVERIVERARPSSGWSSALLDGLTAEDRMLFRTFGQGPSRTVPYELVHRAFEDQARTRPMTIAATHDGRSITYGELDRQAERLARVLADRGVRTGDRVAVFVRRSLPMLVALLGTLKAGAAYVPQDIGITPRAQLRHVLRTSGAHTVLTLSPYEDRVPVTPGTSTVAVDLLMEEPLPLLEEAPPRPGVGPRPEPDPGGEDLCYVLFTSGTTGQPNGVAVTHRNVCNLLHTAPGRLGIEPGMRVSQLLNIAFDMAAWEILGALSHGATLVLRGKDFTEAVREAEVIIATPTILSGLDPADCTRVRAVAVAGEPCPRALADRWAAVCDFHNGCGPTETTIVNTVQRHTPSAERLTIGRPVPNTTVYVLDDHGRPLPIGEVGEMWAGGAGVTAGYLGDPGLTHERYRADPFVGAGQLMFRTRDLCRWTPEGELEHLGRTDDQVKVRGFRVELDAVSAVLESMPGCVRAATVRLDGSTLVSFVSPGSLGPAAARRAVADVLPYYYVPEEVHALDLLPQTSRGKIDKAALVELAERLRDQRLRDERSDVAS
ncbi:amino acid adenylation domain-containing protein [Streptomyces sp. NPDC005955]|uniref:amino acid adenylation domain-containing protein n=1 Tax=Streptomyces sp. NPDC005955 TaxID=3364738 RepID=UPI0036948CFF